MGVSKHFRQIVDGATRHLGGFECRQPISLGARQHDFFKHWHQHLTVFDAFGVLGKTLIDRQLRMSRHATELGILTVIAHRQNKMITCSRTVAGDQFGAGLHFKNLVRHDVLMRVASTAGSFATDQIVGAQIGQHGHLRV